MYIFHLIQVYFLLGLSKFLYFASQSRGRLDWIYFAIWFKLLSIKSYYWLKPNRFFLVYNVGNGYQKFTCNYSVAAVALQKHYLIITKSKEIPALPLPWTVFKIITGLSSSAINAITATTNMEVLYSCATSASHFLLTIISI